MRRPNGLKTALVYSIGDGFPAGRWLQYSHQAALGVCRGALALMLLTGLATSVTAQEAQPEHMAKAEMRYLSQTSLGQGVTFARLSNGMTVMVRENHAAPVATVRSYVTNTGSAYEGRYLGTGISHLVEHLVSGGTTEKRSEEEIQGLIDTLGGQTNAYTSNDVTAYYIDCPAKRVALAIELVADSMQYSAFPEKEYLREMGVVQRELEMGESERSRMSYMAMSKLIFTQHPMRHPTIGYMPVLQKITLEDVVDFYKSRYVPQNMIFVVGGDVDTKQVLDEILENFKTFERTRERGPILPVEPDQASPRSIQLEMEGATTHFSVAWPTVALQHADLYPLDVASYLLTNGDSSRLKKRLQIEQPLAVSVSSASYTPGDVKGWFQITVECKSEDVEECRKIIFDEINKLKEEPASEKELAKVKRQKAAEHVFGQQTVQAQTESLARSYQSTGDPLFDDQYVAGIQDVTAKQITAVMRTYFRPHRLNSVTITPIGSGTTSEESQLADVESDVIRKKLSNGMTVLLKRHSVLPMVSIQAFVKAGVLSDTAENSGLAALATGQMEKGTEKYSAEEIAEFFDSVGGSFGVGSQRNTSYLQCSVLKDDFAQALDYSFQALFKPTFPADEFAKAQQLTMTRISARLNNPQTEILDFWVKQLPASSPFSRTVLGTEETVAKLTVEDCREFHNRVFVPENMVLAIFGDIDPEKTLAKIEATFGKLPAKPFQEAKFASSHEKMQPVNERLENRRPNTALVVVGYPTVSVFDEEERAALGVLNSVLTGGSGAGGRLFNELRGARLVYYVFGFEMTGLAPGYFVFMAQTRPETAGEVVERIQAALEKIRKEGIPEEEFEQTKLKMSASHAISDTTPSSQAFQAAVDELYGLGYDHDKSYDARIEKVTVKDVQDLIQRYFQTPITVTSAPAAPEKPAGN